MILYYAPGACSLTPHIALIESGLDYKLVKVDLATKTTEDGRPYSEVNAKNSVPVLQLENGNTITEGPAIGQYIADRSKNTVLAPENATYERAKLHEALNFISSEVHKSYAPIFSKTTPVEYKPIAINILISRYDYLNEFFSKHKYMANNQFSVADIYLYNVLRWTKNVKLDIDDWPNLKTFAELIEKRPAVQTALKEEGLDSLFS